MLPKKTSTIKRRNSKSTGSIIINEKSNEQKTPNVDNNVEAKKINSNISQVNQRIMQESLYKNNVNVINTDTDKLQSLLNAYTKANLIYRNEEFTQQTEQFLQRIALDPKVPKDLRQRFPLFQILVSICKIFMFNDFEIIIFASMLDYSRWKYENIVSIEESIFLKEFPLILSVEMEKQCKCLIIYLLVMGFSIKQHLNDISEYEKIKAYCEKICVGFVNFFARWTNFAHFKYHPSDLNRKFRLLSKRNLGNTHEKTKDYNVVVDSIMSLTGTHSSKLKPEPKIDNLNPPAPIMNSCIKSMINQNEFHDLNKWPFNLSISRDSSKFGADSYDTPGISRLPSLLNKPSIFREKSNFESYGSNLLTKRQQSNFSNSDYEMDFLKVKKPRQDSSAFTKINHSVNLTLNKQNHTDTLNDELFGLPQLGLSKNPSIFSQGDDIPLPNLSRMNSTFSYFLEKQQIS